MTPYERVKLSRERTAATFPLPGVTDCLRYAVCELAEMDDAWLRIERTEDKRNNAKKLNPGAELGQAFYMLLSAAMRMGVEPKIQGTYLGATDTYANVYAYALHTLAGLLAMSQLSYVAPLRLQVAFNDTYSAMYAAGLINGFEDLDALVEETCAAFEAKHAPAVTA